jgi:hypothetical protein
MPISPPDLKASADASSTAVIAVESARGDLHLPAVDVLDLHRLAVFGVWRLTRRGRGRLAPGTALLDSMELLFDDDRRAAVEIIIEERTGYHDPEDKDGDLPQLERPVPGI